MDRCLWKCHNPWMLSLPFTFPSSEVAHSPSSMAALSVCVPDPHFLFHSLCPRTSCLLPLLNMGQIRETSACLFFKREVLSREHSHSILPISFSGGMGGWKSNIKTQEWPPGPALRRAVGICIPFRGDSQCTKTGKLCRCQFAVSFVTWFGRDMRR